MIVTEEKRKWGGRRPGAGLKPYKNPADKIAARFHLRIHRELQAKLEPLRTTKQTAEGKFIKSDQRFYRRLVELALDRIEAGAVATPAEFSGSNERMAIWCNEALAQRIEQQRQSGENDRQLIERLLSVLLE